jgi:acetyltransferase-like isoleucine patch superfamily enzyme
MTIGNKTFMPKCYVTWPHQVQIGDNCILEHGIYFKFDGVCQPGPKIVIGANCFVGSSCEFNIRTGITIESDCLIASGCRFIDGNHGMDRGSLMRSQQGTDRPIVVGEGAWLGANVIVLSGVTIGAGAIVGAGSVVTKSIPPFTVFAGVPASKIRDRPYYSQTKPV